MFRAHDQEGTEPSRSLRGPRAGARRYKMLALWVVLVAAGALFAYRRAVSRAERLPVLIQIEGFSLVDQTGKKVELADLRGTTWVADFIFTGCQSACPLLTARMHSLQEHLEKREQKLGHPLPIRLVSFTVDPEVDTPQKLSEYAAQWGADSSRWLFLTGSLAEVNRAVTRGMKIPFEKGGADTSAFDVMHGEKLVVVDALGRIRGYFDADPDGLERIRSALEELASERGDKS